MSNLFRVFVLLSCLCLFIFCDNKLSGTDNIIKTPIDSIVVIKSERILIVFNNNKELKRYSIALGKNPVGKKHFEHDMKTPEGLYYINAKNPKSQYYKNLNISYPNQKDRDYAKFHKKKTGGDIKIHGLPKGFKEEDYTVTDWTWGCIGLTNTEIDELYNYVKMGSPILILP